MTDKQLFADAIRIFNGPCRPPAIAYDPEDPWCMASIKRAANRAEHFRRNEASRFMPRVILGFVYDPRFNAAAFTHPNPAQKELFIAVNGGAPIVIQQLFGRLLSEPEVLPWIGDPSVETPGPRFKVATNAQDVVDHFVKSGINPFERMPKDPQRQKAILVLSILAMEYLLEHELCHIKGGHLSYVSQLTGRSFIHEAYGNAETTTIAMQLQALEMEADCFAACHTLHTAFTFCDDKEGLPYDIIPDIDSALFFSHFAMYSVWRLFGDALPKSENWKLLDHPPTRMRQRLIESMLLTAFKARAGKDGHERYGAQFVKSGSEAELGFAKIQGCDPEMDGTIQVLSADSNRHMEELKVIWISMEEQLKRVSYYK